MNTASKSMNRVGKMPDNPLDKPDAPEPPDYSQQIEQQNQLAREMAQVGREQLDYTRGLDAYRLGAAQPFIDQQAQIGAINMGDATRTGAMYDAYYQPTNQLQVLDAFGAGWLGTDARNELIDGLTDIYTGSLEDAYTEYLGAIDLTQARNKANPTPRHETGGFPVVGGAPVAAPGGTTQYQTTAGLPYYGPATAGVQSGGVPITPVGGTEPKTYGLTPAEQQADYRRQERFARGQRNRDIASAERSAETQKMLYGVQDSAEAAAVGRAAADAEQANANTRTAIMNQARSMGIDPTRALNTMGAYAPSSAATRVNAGNNARFGIRNATSANIGNVANVGRGFPAVASSQYGTAAGSTGAALGGTNATVSGAVNSTSAAAPFFGAASSGYNNAANIMNAGYGNQVNQYNAELAAGNGFWDLAGTLGGAYLYGHGFPGV